MMLHLWNPVSDRLEIVFVLVQDMCMVCAKRTIGSETILDAPMVLLGDEAQVQAHFGLFSTSLMQDRCTVCAKHTIGSEIILDAPMVLIDDEAQVETRSQSVLR